MLNNHESPAIVANEQGFSITEVLVACSLSGILIAAVASQAAQSHIDLSSLQHATSIEDDMRALQNTISHHVSKAGYFYTPDELSPIAALTNTPLRPKNILITHRSSEPKNSCITFSYDKNNDGVTSSVHGELQGYRLNNKAIEYRVGGKSCEQGGWFDLTDTKTVTATLFKITLISQSSWGSSYEIEIELQSKITPTVKSYKRFVVEVWND